jgi:hypothetical protein
LHATYGEKVQFLVVYINEAHALDGANPMGGGSAPIVEEPLTLDAKKEVAKICMGALDLAPMTMLVDGMDNKVATAYAAFPDRLYLVDAKGKIALSGAKGPRGFEPDDLEDAIRADLGMEPIRRTKKKKGR